MSTQPEQTLENNLIAQLENLGFDRVRIADEKALISNLKKQLEKHNKTLEVKVNERTEELNKKILELKDARSAALNLLEDMDYTSRELRRSYQKLEEADRVRD